MNERRGPPAVAYRAVIIGADGTRNVRAWNVSLPTAQAVETGCRELTPNADILIEAQRSIESRPV